MCTNGVNVGQLESMIDQIDDHIALEYRWVHKIAHMAENAGLNSTSEKLHTAQHMLADVRATLDEAKETLESDAARVTTDSTSVHLV